jgi:hypothetical protein
LGHDGAPGKRRVDDREAQADGLPDLEALGVGVEHELRGVERLQRRRRAERR